MTIRKLKPYNDEVSQKRLPNNDRLARPIHVSVIKYSGLRQNITINHF